MTFDDQERGSAQPAGLDLRSRRETSCELRNLFLDRTLLVDTMASDGAAFFRVP
jgi:hypothetical protein